MKEFIALMHIFINFICDSQSTNLQIIEEIKKEYILVKS